MSKIEIKFQNFGGTGFADSRKVEQGTTAAQFFRNEFPSSNPGDYRITVNNIVPASDYVLEAGDTMIVVPSQKHEGA